MDFYNYFQAYEDYFWTREHEYITFTEISEVTEIISLHGNLTIAYGNYIEELLENLAEQGLPPFGALLLIIIATNKTIDNTIALIEKLTSEYLIEKGLFTHANSEALANTISFLNKLAEVPEKYKKGQGRHLLLQTLFANCHNIISVKKSKNIVQQYKKRQFDKRKFLKQQPFHVDVYFKDFRTIALIAKKFPNVADIIAKIADIPLIEEPLKELETQITQETLPKDFVQDLIDNPKTFHVGSLLKHIWAGLNIPFHNHLPSEQPLGGIADLTNKGDFDKLLISEFANEDVIFLSRLANNEALYIHREIPPAADNLERIILIDISLKNWGTPKVLAYAILLAIAKHPKTNIACKAFAIGEIYSPISFENIDEIIESLQILDGNLHAAQGVESFLKAYAPLKNTEIFFIASPSAMKMPAMQKIFSDYQTNFKYWITVAQEGSIEIYKNQQNGKKLVQQIQLSLEELWKRQEPKADTIKEKEESVLQKYPILFPRMFNPKKVLSIHNEIFIVSNEKKLFKIGEHRQKGLTLILENLPNSITNYEIGQAENGDYLLLCFVAQSREIIVYNLTTKEAQKVYFTEWRSLEMNFFFMNDSFYYIYANNYYHKIQYIPTLTTTKYNYAADSYGQFLAFYNQREAELKKAENSYIISTNQDILKNIKRISISSDGNLMINNHHLIIDLQGKINLSLRQTIKEVGMLATYEPSKNDFTFPDGSKIYIDRSGILTLKSSNATIPDIFIPSVLNYPLGVATETQFAGNEFFYNSSVEKPLEKIDITLFFEKYLKAFIDVITWHYYYD